MPTDDDLAQLALSDEDRDRLSEMNIPDQPEVEIDDTTEEWLATAAEARAGDLERISIVSEEGIRYLTELSDDPITDGYEHGEDTDELIRLSQIAEQPDSLLEVATLQDLRLLEEIEVREAIRGAAGGVRIPGAVWRPFTNRTVSTTPLIGPRSITEHTMGVGTMLGSWSYHNKVGMPYTHTYYDGIGNRVQAQGADRRAAGTLEGNPFTIAKETEDYGRYFPNGGRTCGTIPPWRQEQLRVIAIDDAWCCVRFGIPPVLMPDSCASTRGIGYHRLGIYPWRKFGCLRYSNSNYKCCPDIARIAQMVGLVRAIAAIVGGRPPAPSWPPPFPGTVRLTTPYMMGGHVDVWQKGLINWARMPITGGVDGVWGPASNHVLVEFQRRVGVTADGIGGPVTWGKLAVMAPKPTPPQPIPTTRKGAKMLYLVKCDDRPHWWVTDWLTKRHMANQVDVNLVIWFSTTAGVPISTAKGADGKPTGQPHVLKDAEQKRRLDDIPVVGELHAPYTPH